MKERKQPYDDAKIELVSFSGEDIITASWGNVDPDGGDWS
jgi:hypothetical protein